MKKIYFLLFAFAICTTISAQTLQSPEKFLGYKIGEHYTPHYKILNYFNAVAQAVPQMVKIEKYGETYEGRDLIVAYIASGENMQRLDEIRMNNLRLAGIAKDNAATVTNASAIVWLSYNVHGNEPSSSEAAMLTLFALVDPNNSQTKEWLKNTLVIIDPCLNPDGRERYVSWYTNAAGMQFNADPQSREHDELWPYGRTNHYNFDLNRDWAWQTQKESAARIKKYNEWLPQVHVDFHEQGYNEPYYFAPAAEPYHKVITQWQRDFQTRIGKNNAKYFDEKGWLYFTKEFFDLFYPSYGDTYPTYNGSIGMTYEQGGISAGLGIKTEEGDTLTLSERALHHYTTSLSTIEVSSKNAGQLINEFKKFFDDNMHDESTEYKAYILTAKDANKIKEVTDLLDANGIEYGSPSSNTLKGYNYFTNKEEDFADEGNILAVNALQPKGKLLKVLFEPKSMLSDSATYDITAWAVPYAYGVKAYGIKDNIELLPYKNAAGITTVSANYGLLIPYTSFSAAELLSELLQKKVKVRFALKPFTYNEKKFERGTLIVLKGNNIDNWNAITNEACKKFNIQPTEAESGFMEAGADFGSPDVRLIKAPRVALLTGREVSASAAGEVWSLFDNSLHYPITQLNSEELSELNLQLYDVLIVPDGSYSSFNNKDVTDKIQNFLKGGGKIIAMENGAAKFAGMDFTNLKLKEDTSAEKDSAVIRKFANYERDELSNSIPGAIYKVELDNTHPLAFGYPDFYYTLKQDAHLYKYLKDGWNVGTIKSSGYVSGFVGSKLKQRLKDGMLVGDINYEDGNIILLSDNPLFRLFWQNGKLMFANAVFLVGE